MCDISYILEQYTQTQAFELLLGEWPNARSALAILRLTDLDRPLLWLCELRHAESIR